MVPERDKVDDCFREAQKNAEDKNTLAIVYALEGIARSIRDADDTQDNIRRELVGVLNENAVLISDRITESANALNSLTQQMREHNGKKGLF